MVMAHIAVPFDEVDPLHVWTVDDLERLPEDWRRYEIVDGQLVMVPPSSVGHQVVVDRLKRRIDAAFGGSHVVLEGVGLDIAPTFRIPDIMAFGTDAYSAKSVTVLPRDVALVVEVVSPGSRTNDRITKPAEYAAAAIGAYWRVDLHRGRRVGRRGGRGDHRSRRRADRRRCAETLIGIEAHSAITDRRGCAGFSHREGRSDHVRSGRRWGFALIGGPHMTIDSKTRVNDVDLAAVGGLVEAISADPAKAQTTWAAHVTWKGAFASEARVRTFAPTQSDEPPALGGGDTAANPVEQLLSALGNCLAVGYAANASVAGIAIDQLKVDLKGDLDLRVFLGLAEGHAGFDSITANVSLVSEAPREEIEALHAKVLASSPVGHTLRNAVPVEIQLVR